MLVQEVENIVNYKALDVKLITWLSHLLSCVKDCLIDNLNMSPGINDTKTVKHINARERGILNLPHSQADRTIPTMQNQLLRYTDFLMVIYSTSFNFGAVFASSLQVVQSACYKSIVLIALEGLALELSSGYFDLYLPIAFCFVSQEPGPET